jgi:alkylation response protein AidB-like acyl-CoA dehydrogenase
MYVNECRFVCPGVTFGANEHKLGWNSQPTAIVDLQDVRVPAANMLGAEGEGFSIAMKGLDGGRINIGTTSLGGAIFCLEEAVTYTKTRKQFGKPIATNQHIQFALADMATNLQGSRMLIHKAAELLDAGDPRATQVRACVCMCVCA